MKRSGRRSTITALLVGAAIAGIAWYVFGRDPVQRAQASPAPSAEERLAGENPLEFEITGRVVTEGGEPVAHARIVVTIAGEELRETGTENVSSSSDPAGKFRIPFVDMPGASFERVEATHPELGSSSRSLIGIAATGHLDVGELVLRP